MYGYTCLGHQQLQIMLSCHDTKLLYTEHNKQKKRTEKFTLLSDHNESLLQRQPGAQYAELETMQCDDC